ncbi:hypothetical protein F0562_000083 [Nyssa sinensis]|uniref:Uncharacterized protein n=1 Tax=Nyssa sinensis TaxID=561372 RepID=A0A5J5BZN2_9ASTE|nr:hypothetical protein F0562_000083 [Nyssa sinensis]
MAEEFLVSFAAELILQKVVSSAVEEISLAWGLKGDVKKLNKTLTMLQALLRDYEKTKVKGEAMTLWLKNLEDVAYHADDVLDEFDYEILRRKVEIRNQMMKKLGCLKNLRGQLKIYHLEHVRSREEAQKVNLSRNSNIHLLKFHWGEEREEENNNDEDVLEGLKPHENLKSLTIENFEGENFPSWVVKMMSHKLYLHNLVKIKLVNCNKCQQMPTMGHLLSLKVVEIDGMPNLKQIGSEFYGQNHEVASSSHGATSVAVFPVLRELTLANMPNLAEWFEAESLQPSRTVFSQLEKLKIVGCPQLITAPGHFPSIKQLSIEGINHCSVLAKMCREVSSLTDIELLDVSGSTELSSMLEKLLVNNNKFLRVLKIERCTELICLPNKLETLVSLEWLRIWFCDNLTAIPDLRSLTSLQYLHIAQCEKLTTYWPEGLLCLTTLTTLGIGGFSSEVDYFPWPSEDITQHLVSLKHLFLHGGPKLKSLPDQLEHLTFLPVLGIFQFESLEVIPEWLGDHSIPRLNTAFIIEIVFSPWLHTGCRIHWLLSG